METNTPDDQRQSDELTPGERRQLTEAEREVDDLDDGVPGPDQDLNMALENLPQEIEDADERYGLDRQTQEAEFSIFKLAALIAGIVIAILLVVAVIWIF